MVFIDLEKISHGAPSIRLSRKKDSALPTFDTTKICTRGQD